MNYFFSELRRAIVSKIFFISFVIGFLSLFLGGFEYLTWRVGSTYLFSYAYDSGTMCTFIFIAPIIVSLPASLTYIMDNEHGFSKNLYLRMSKLKYAITKFTVNAIVGGLTIFIITFSYYIFCLVIKGIRVSDVESMNINGLYLSLYNKNQIMCMLIVVSLTIIFGMVFSSFSLAISSFVKNKYLSIILPFCLYLFLGMFLYDYKLINLQLLYSLRYFPEVSVIYRLIYTGILLFMSFILFFIGIQTRGGNFEQ